jgi:hypothetical protein
MRISCFLCLVAFQNFREPRIHCALKEAEIEPETVAELALTVKAAYHTAGLQWCTFLKLR